MINSIAMASSPSSSLLRFTSKTPKPSSPSLSITPSSIAQTLKHCAKATIFLAATAAAAATLTPVAARAHTPPPIVADSPSPLTEFIGSNPDAVEALKALLQQTLESGDDVEALKLLRQLSLSQPDHAEWKLVTARVLAETGDIRSARQVFEEILAADPLSFEALFENALLMDRNGETEAVIGRLEAALRAAEEAKKAKEARDVRMIIAQVRFLQKDVEGALRDYDELTKEDPSDFRPYFCRGMIYSLMDRNAEAREQFRKFRELSPRKFEVEGFLRSPLSKMKLFGTDED